jgi:hypothetical protein
MKKLFVFLCASLLFFSIASEGICDIFYAIGLTEDYQNSILFRINSETREVTYIERVGRLVSDLAYAPDGSLYAFDTSESSKDPQTKYDALLKIDPSDGYILDFKLLIADCNPHYGVGIAFQQNGTLYASDTGELFTIDPSTGDCTSVATDPVLDDIDGLEFSSDGTLYGINGAGSPYTLYNVDLNNVEDSIRIPYDYPHNIQSLAFDPNGYLFGIDNGSQENRGDEYLVIIDPTTGNVINIGGPITEGFYTALVYGGPNPTSIPINIDIKPNSCPNALNIDPKGILTVAILGTADLNVSDIDPLSVSLEGVAPIRSSIKDVATPVVNPQSYCECNSEWEDGFDDLILKFKTSDVVDALGEVQHGDKVGLILTGKLDNETSIEGHDCVVFVSKGN